MFSVRFLSKCSKFQTVHSSLNQCKKNFANFKKGVGFFVISDLNDPWFFVSFLFANFMYPFKNHLKYSNEREPMSRDKCVIRNIFN